MHGSCLVGRRLDRLGEDDTKELSNKCIRIEPLLVAVICLVQVDQTGLASGGTMQCAQAYDSEIIGTLLQGG